MSESSPANLNISQNRYTSIIISVVVFLLLTSGVLATSVYNSLKIRDLRAGTSLASDLRSDMPALTQELYLLNVMRQSQAPVAVQQEQTAVINALMTEMDSEITTLKEGGEVSIRGEQVDYQALTQADQVQTIQSTDTLWDNYTAQAQNFLNTSTVLDAATLESQFGMPTQAIYDNATTLADSLNAENGSRAAFLRNLQIFGISFAIIYFIVFVLYFVRRLKRSDEELIVARRETQEIMQTVNTGLFLLDKDLNIGQQHSKALTDIIGSDQLAGKNFANVLRGRISDKDLTTTRQFIEQLYNPRVKEKLVDALNPLHKVMLHNASSDEQESKSRFLDFKFSRVYEDKDIARILVNVNDVSDAVFLEQRLEKERSQNDMQIEMLTTILNVNPKIINEFITNTKSHIDKMNNTLKNPGSSQYELEVKLKAIYREIHSLKGEASALKLHSFTKIASDAEDKLHVLQNQGQLSGNDFLPLTVHLDDMLSLSNTIENLGERINRGTSASAQPAARTASTDSAGIDILSADTQVNTDTEVSLSDDTDSHLLAYYQDFTQDIASRQNKQVQLTSDSLGRIKIPERLQSAVKEISIQLLRNAVVHGVETPTERASSGKSAVGTIDLEIKNEADNLIITLQDDGQGIDYDRVRERLVTMGRFSQDEAANLSQSELLTQLFSSGFSTKDDADEDGGRGVGLDIIKATVQEYDGKLNVNSERGRMTRFVVTLPAA